VRIKLLSLIAGPAGCFHPGVHDFPETMARELVATHHAELLPQAPAEGTPPATAEGEAEGKGEAITISEPEPEPEPLRVAATEPPVAPAPEPVHKRKR